MMTGIVPKKCDVIRAIVIPSKPNNLVLVTYYGPFAWRTRVSVKCGKNGRGRADDIKVTYYAPFARYLSDNDDVLYYCRGAVDDDFDS